MARSGRSLGDILDALSSFRLPAGELAKLRLLVEEDMSAALLADRSMGSSLSPAALEAASLESIRASYELTTPQIKSSIKNYLVKETRRAMASGSGASGLKRNLAAASGAAESELQTLSNAMVAQYNNLLTFNQARSAGVTRFLYSGPVAPSTRPFCQAHAGIVFTVDEISQMDNGQGLPVANSCGGYNCRHEWVMVPEGLSAADVGGRTIGRDTQTMQVGKMTMVVDEKSKAALFATHKMIKVDAEKYDHTAEWYSVAKPLARAHDGLNETITNSPADGVWTSRRRTDRTTGEIVSNFESHMTKHMDEFGSRDDYRSAMAQLISSNDTVVFRDATSFILFQESSNDILIVNHLGQIETFYRWDRKMHPNFFNDKKSLNSITSYL